MENNQIIFNIQDNKVRLTYRNKNLTITDFLQVISTGILMAMKGVVESAPENQREQIQEELYDMYNAAASNTLHYFAPNIDMRPSLTTQAIMDAEDAIINKEYNKARVNPNYHSKLVDKPKIKIIK